MDDFNHRFYENRFPEINEAVIVKITQNTDVGVYVELLEYNNIQGLIMLGELSKKKIKSISSFIKPNTIDVVIVLRVDQEKGYIDVSKRKVCPDEFNDCCKKYAKNKLAHSVMILAAKQCGKSIEALYNEYFAKVRPYNGLYNYFLKVNNNEIVDEISEFVKKKFNASKFKIRADVDVSCHKGVAEVIEALKSAKNANGKIDVALLRMPIYSLSLIESNKDDGLRDVTLACQLVKEKIEKLGGRFRMNSEPVVYGSKGNLDQLTSKMDGFCDIDVEDLLNSDD